MPSNIEIKARINDPDRFRSLASKLADSQNILHQEDTFYHSPNGRLKLRCFPDGTGQLIRYNRPDQTGPKQSTYWISRTNDPQTIHLALSNTLGIIGTVRKKRELFLVGKTRIHLDHVEELGVFAELEVVMQPGQTTEDGVAIANDLMQQLNITPGDLIDRAYIDLLTQNPPDAPNYTG